MASEMLSKVLDAENSDREAQKAAHEQAQKTVDAAVEAGEGAVARKRPRLQRERRKSSKTHANRRVQTKRKPKGRPRSASAKCLPRQKRTEPMQSKRSWRRLSDETAHKLQKSQEVSGWQSLK